MSSSQNEKNPGEFCKCRIASDNRENNRKGHKKRGRKLQQEVKLKTNQILHPKSERGASSTSILRIFMDLDQLIFRVNDKVLGVIREDADRILEVI